jgi:hypothetical protein
MRQDTPFIPVQSCPNGIHATLPPFLWGILSCGFVVSRIRTGNRGRVQPR